MGWDGLRFVVVGAAGGGGGASGKQRKNRGPSFKIGAVAVNAKTLLACEKDLEPLDKVLPASSEERANWTLNAK